jgi:adenylosuccinate lyase
MRSFDEAMDFKTLLMADAEVTAMMPAEALERMFDLDVHLRHVDKIFERVFGTNTNQGEGS